MKRDFVAPLDLLNVPDLPDRPDLLNLTALSNLLELTMASPDDSAAFRCKDRPCH
jgi:hypothetical protein